MALLELIPLTDPASLSARRAWIEIKADADIKNTSFVALRKESVDRNCGGASARLSALLSLSARRAWIEITVVGVLATLVTGRSPQGERG